MEDGINDTFKIDSPSKFQNICNFKETSSRH